MRRRNRRDRWRSMSKCRNFGTRRLVDQLDESLPYPRVVEWLELVIEDEALPRAGGDLFHARDGAALELINLLRRNVIDDVYGAALQSGKRRRGLWDDSQDVAV